MKRNTTAVQCGSLLMVVIVTVLTAHHRVAGQVSFTPPIPLPTITYPPGTCGPSQYNCSITPRPGQICFCDLDCLDRTPPDCCMDFYTCLGFCSQYQTCDAVAPVPGQKCQCFAGCTNNADGGPNECCIDQADVCGENATLPVPTVTSTCDSIGCGNSSSNCSCSVGCMQNSSCCIDFSVRCAALIPTTIVTTVVVTTQPPVQNCTALALRNACESRIPGYACYCNQECAKTNTCCPSYNQSPCKPVPLPLNNCTAAGLANRCAFNDSFSCQCDPGCESAIGNSACCPGYRNSTCVPTVPTMPPTTPMKTLCVNEGCMFSDTMAPCRCDSACKTNNDCCDDYDAVCVAVIPPPPRPWCADRTVSEQCLFVKDNSSLRCQCDPTCHLFTGEYTSHGWYFLCLRTINPLP